ncbi:MAG: hypothetical protein O8C66_10735 [Candidatus Methanoperedens sp.]|nr:hypothetical protein [Candidatus Methanoperedens sp.]MCZ7370973.1 hypothetical protein [Candidatus Methanoperedens sp.]
MARKLGPSDLLILKKLAPELVDPTCAHAGHEFRSVLPPVSQHFSRAKEDFRERLLKLSEEELNYLVDLIFEGMESLHCVKKEHVDALIEVVSMRLSKVKATELLEFYKFAGD